MHDTQHLSFDVHLDNGRILHFEQDDPVAVASALQRLQPTRVFAEEQLVVAGDTHTTTLPTRAILYIHMRFDKMPEWAFRSDHEVEQISAEDFADVAARRVQREQAPSGNFIAHAEMNLVNGSSIYLRATGQAPPIALRARASIRLLEQSSLMLRSAEGGLLAIRPASISSLAIYPGAPEVPSSAVLAHLVAKPNVGQGES